MFRVEARCELRPTEDRGKVVRAITNVLSLRSDEIRIVEGGKGRYMEVVAVSHRVEALQKLHTLLRQDRILDTARKLMLNSLSASGRITIKLHKQSAYAGHLSFVTYDEESPLGPLRIVVEGDNLSEIVDWLAPKTKDGKPLWELSMPGNASAAD